VQIFAAAPGPGDRRAGFIGYHLCERLLDDGVQVLGVDSLTPYYDPRLKADRLARLSAREGFRFERLDLADRVATAELFAREPFDAVLHLAAQAGVRYSVENPLAYLDSNLAGMMNVLEGCRHARVGTWSTHRPVRSMVPATPCPCRKTR